MLNWPAKDPQEVLDYQADWTSRLEADEVLVASTFSVVSGSVVINSQTFVDGVATVWLSGGTAGETCVILNRVTTSAGRVYDQSMRLRIRSR